MLLDRSVLEEELLAAFNNFQMLLRLLINVNSIAAPQRKGMEIATLTR
jgi:hypothetical protein